MASVKKSGVSLYYYSAALLLILMALSAEIKTVRSQSCVGQLSNLNTCAPFVVPGQSAIPSAECCSALQEVDQGCLCSTLQIAARMPVACRLPAITCGNNH
ncbi:Bifunctional inhibitor/plant lipid transfer protein/seed storage helical domain [Macleaya cordata]|uniref:Bifunctional inhibitor/plant lipid transfer protein/seed storage helical domain n=1 Tax=Macleaya cordata TaxID=56857 RepID=A0A200QUL5_MACCD|nr:Bifunctional inhibitor/plant lipid transfer protein/seed storage helical domain [Macleaya cordata]